MGYLHVQGHVFDVLERGAIQTVHRDVDHSVIIGGNGRLISCHFAQIMARWLLRLIHLQCCLALLNLTL